MKIEVKNIQIAGPTGAVRPLEFNADLFINGALAGKCSEEWYGYPLHYSPVDKAGAELIRQAERYFKALPKEEATDRGKIGSLSPNSLADAILLQVLEYKRGQMKETRIPASEEWLNRYQNRHIIYGVPGMYFVNMDRISPSFDAIRANPLLHEPVATAIRRDILPKLGEWDMILNTNIPAEILQKAGLRPEQYRVSEAEEVKKDLKRSRRRGHWL
ncbi:hypothetical protein [Olivibacter jilunii]|uniref:hypothetical protein n=1 Tax=Olivibacter jilunii TaxID=985016 RepID=UPI001030E00D|nr:hypothetical protein [Olivibacter jilunii]